MKGASSIYFSFLHTDSFDVLNVGFNFHSQPSHDVFGIGLCQKSDKFCHDELLGEDFGKKFSEIFGGFRVEFLIHKGPNSDSEIC